MWSSGQKYSDFQGSSTPGPGVQRTPRTPLARTLPPFWMKFQRTTVEIYNLNLVLYLETINFFGLPARVGWALEFGQVGVPNYPLSWLKITKSAKQTH